jgi:hypothetical protein
MSLWIETAAIVGPWTVLGTRLLVIREIKMRAVRPIGLMVFGLFGAIGLTACGSNETTGTEVDGNIDGWSQLNVASGGKYPEVATAYSSAIARCMKEKGWDFKAQDLSFVAPQPRDLYEEWGFGISTVVGRESEYEQLFVGPADPNSELVAQLDAAAFARYSEDLSGSEAPGGCTRSSIEKTFGADSPLLNSALISEYQRLVDVGSGSAPELVAAMQSWSSCVSEAGLTATDPEDLKADLVSQLDEWRAAGGSAEALQKIQRLEIRVAQSSFECESKFIDPALAEHERAVFAQFREKYKL